MKHIDYELLGFISILLFFLGLLFIIIGLWKGVFIPLGIILFVISIGQLYVILFTKDKH